MVSTLISYDEGRWFESSRRCPCHRAAEMDTRLFFCSWGRKGDRAWCWPCHNPACRKVHGNLDTNNGKNSTKYTHYKLAPSAAYIYIICSQSIAASTPILVSHYTTFLCQRSTFSILLDALREKKKNCHVFDFREPSETNNLGDAVILITEETSVFSTTSAQLTDHVPKRIVYNQCKSLVLFLEATFARQ